MERLKTILEKYSRWQEFRIYVSRIESQRGKDFSFCIENAKSLIEGISKEICRQKNQTLNTNDSVSKVLNLSFGSLGYAPTNVIRKIGGAIVTIGQNIGEFRNDVGSTSHGKNIEELKKRNDNLDSFTTDFLLESVELICCFLIEAFETDNPISKNETTIVYEEKTAFNVYWDNTYSEYKMTEDYTYYASEILYYCDYEAYKYELNNYKVMQDETNN